MTTAFVNQTQAIANQGHTLVRIEQALLDKDRTYSNSKKRITASGDGDDLFGESMLGISVIDQGFIASQGFTSSYRFTTSQVSF